MKREPPPAETLVSFREATMELDNVYSMFSKECGLSEAEYWSLVLIYEGAATQSEISSQLFMSRQTLNSAFKQLIRKGLVRLAPFEHDQRSKRALLTPEGQRFVETTIAQSRYLEEQAWKTLTREEQADLIRLTHQFSTALRRVLKSQQN